MPQTAPTLEKIVSLCKRRGFVFPTSEVYGGLTSSYDYGPLGAQLLKNIRDAWWHTFVESRPDMVGLDSQILLHPQTWVASGHVSSFNDPLVEDVKTHKRYRADHLLEGWLKLQESAPAELSGKTVEDLSVSEMGELIKKYHVLSPEGNPVSEPKQFNLLFETAIGAVADEKSKIYLRGETAQGIFTNFKQVLDSTRVTLPFGIGQIGKSFRNEVTTGQFVFRTLELEQAEIEYFFDPEQADWQTLLESWKNDMWHFVTETLGVNAEHLRWRQHTDTERSFYSQDTYDLDYQYPFGFKELWGVAYRSDYDLTQHQKLSGTDMNYRDPQTNKVFLPHVIEPALGIGRALLMVLCDAYWEDEERQRTVLRLKPSLAPFQVAVFPLLKNKPELVSVAKTMYQDLLPEFRATWDDRGNIGKRYLYQDEIGTPFCVTVDFETLEDQAVTVRNRDTAEQERVAMSKLSDYLKSQQ
ncbi:glycine--tRNA ligase [Candidatus Woesebacteria bacterium]|nr:glycine--tRNA ligase [Candidatus Woesebacteria bacterium]